MRMVFAHFSSQLFGSQCGKLYFLRQESLHLLHEKAALRSCQHSVLVVRQSRCQSVCNGLEQRRTPVGDHLQGHQFGIRGNEAPVWIGGMTVSLAAEDFMDESDASIALTAPTN